MKSIKTSVLLRITVILLAILISGGVTIFGVVNINNTNRRLELSTSLHAISLESEKAHYLFLVNLQSAINMGTEFQPKDYQTCGLGEFIYSDLSKYKSVYTDIYELVEEIKPIHRDIHEYANQILAITENSEQQANELYVEQVAPKVASLVEKLDYFIANSQKISEQEAVKLELYIKITAFFIVVCTFVSLFASFLLVKYIFPMIVDPLIEITHSSRKLADGDLDFEICIGNNSNEVGALADALNESVKELQSYVKAIRKSMAKMVNGDLTIQESIVFKGEFQIIQEAILGFEKSINSDFVKIRKSSEQVAAASLQVAGSSNLLAEGSIQQNTSIQELLTTVQDITERIKKNTKNAEHARIMVEDVGESMAASNEKMSEMMRAMDDIGSHSGKINDLIAMIEEISVQTNILALNVAVEAASVGEAGKGFAAVAVEVRNLAEKSSKIAQDSSQLINDTLSSVRHGMNVAHITGELLTKSVEGAEKVSTTIRDISTESGRQSQAVSEILEGMNQISIIVQNNTAVAEESTATSEELEEQANILKDMISAYKLNENIEMQFEDEVEEEVEDFDDGEIIEFEEVINGSLLIG